MTRMQIGFVGLGAMGLPMTRHLLAAGHDVTVASRGRGPIDAAIAALHTHLAAWPRDALMVASAANPNGSTRSEGCRIGLPMCR